MVARFALSSRHSLADSASHHAPRPERSALGSVAQGRTGLAGLHRSVGNASLERLLPASAADGHSLIGQPGDRYEQQAARMAADVVAPAAAQPSIPSPGSRDRLSAGMRAWMEPRLGADLGGVRLHTDGAAAELAQRLSARAVTIGQDIYFGAGQFRPDTRDGCLLLAHESAHTVQQAGPAVRHASLPGGELGRPPLIQRQPAGTTQEAPITATTLLPYPQGTRLALNRIMPDALFDLLSSQQPEVGASLRAIDRQVATVTTASDDLVAATVAEPITLPGPGGASTTYRDVTVSLRRHQDGTFTLSLTARTEGQTDATTLFERSNLTPRREGSDFVLSSGTAAAPVPELRIGPGAERGQTRVQAYSAPYLDQMPAIARSLAPTRIDMLQLTALPDAPAGSAREQAAVADLASRTAAARQLPTQQVTVGGGLSRAAGQVSPLLTAAWQISFRPVTSISGFVQVPLEVQLQYAPPASVLGSVSSGVQGSLAPLRIPVNLRLLAGGGGGTVQGPAPGPGAAAPLLPAIGPTAGIGVGVELGAWRFDARYEHLFNLVSSSPGVDTFGLRVGRAF